MSNKTMRKNGEFHGIRERIEGDLSVYELTLAAIDETPRAFPDIHQRVNDYAGRTVNPAVIHRHIRRAIGMGAAVKIGEPPRTLYREPDDMLSESRWGGL